MITISKTEPCPDETLSPKFYWHPKSDLLFSATNNVRVNERSAVGHTWKRIHEKRNLRGKIYAENGPKFTYEVLFSSIVNFSLKEGFS